MRSLALVGVVVAAFAAAQASATPQTTQVIRPAQAIGKIRLGMTEAQLRRAMGRPRAVIQRRASFGLRAFELQYGFADYTARLFGRPGRLRVVRVATTLVRERTRTGVGVGSLERAVVRAYPRVRCEQLGTYRIAGVVYTRNTERNCTLFAPSGRRTTFATWVRRNNTIGEHVSVDRWRRQARVIEVSVSEPS
jgi:hypothetical protein